MPAILSRPWSQAMKPFRSIDTAGFSIPELTISSVLLALVAINSAKLFIRSQSSIQSTSLRDASYALIAKDVEHLRAKAYEFGCEGLTDSGVPNIAPSSPDPDAASCTGLSRDASKPLKYKTARMPAIAPYGPACLSNNMADALVEAYTLPDKTEWRDLAWEGNGITSDQLPAGVERVTIERNINPSRNELAITYRTTPTSPVKIQLKTILTPQAVGWCP